ncbi:MAG: hypothetical protein U5R31_07640 [Acidimicrobiia bacterium]|nr:hypothetical protein [Acidimicrobiia bacterium]
MSSAYAPSCPYPRGRRTASRRSPTHGTRPPIRSRDRTWTAPDLAHVRRVAATSREDVIEDYGAEQVRPGRGILSASSRDDGEVVTEPPGYHLVVTLPDEASCPDTPVICNGTVLWFVVGWPP